ncbi:hypothetical protein MEL_005 [Melbournevirus]|uniref:hypothetical protein n=1 Tax=Melbournevirus TaxID=1560514 RepID=UPI00051F5213|nr:hypothetical protein MEL_005 [Melbournevirus]AIT54618.1 hypothetical protein MEL_005 [Melbournevirus]
MKMSRLLNDVHNFLETHNPSDVFVEMFSHQNCTTVSFNIGNPRVSFYWVEAECGDEWWYAFPGENGTSDPQVLFGTIQQRIENWEKQNPFVGTD